MQNNPRHLLNIAHEISNVDKITIHALIFLPALLILLICVFNWSHVASFRVLGFWIHIKITKFRVGLMQPAVITEISVNFWHVLFSFQKVYIVSFFCKNSEKKKHVNFHVLMFISVSGVRNYIMMTLNCAVCISDLFNTFKRKEKKIWHLVKSFIKQITSVKKWTSADKCRA